MWRKVIQVGEEGPRRRTMYFSTVDLVTSIPIFRSSPAIFGAPHSGLAADNRRMRPRTSFATGPEETVGGLESRPFHGSPVDGELVPEGESNTADSRSSIKRDRGMQSPESGGESGEQPSRVPCTEGGCDFLMQLRKNEPS